LSDPDRTLVDRYDHDTPGRQPHRRTGTSPLKEKLDAPLRALADLLGLHRGLDRPRPDRDLLSVHRPNRRPRVTAAPRKASSRSAACTRQPGQARRTPRACLLKHAPPSARIERGCRPVVPRYCCLPSPRSPSARRDTALHSLVKRSFVLNFTAACVAQRAGSRARALWLAGGVRCPRSLAPQNQNAGRAIWLAGQGYCGLHAENRASRFIQKRVAAVLVNLLPATVTSGRSRRGKPQSDSGILDLESFSRTYQTKVGLNRHAPEAIPSH